MSHNEDTDQRGHRDNVKVGHMLDERMIVNAHYSEHHDQSENDPVDLLYKEAVSFVVLGSAVDLHHSDDRNREGQQKNEPVEIFDVETEFAKHICQLRPESHSPCVMLS